MKIKVFKFEVANTSSSPCSDDCKHQWFKEQQNALFAPEEVEDVINDFCYDKEVIDIKINNVDIHYHNNARGNTIELWYTIMYKEVK